LILSILQKVLI